MKITEHDNWRVEITPKTTLFGFKYEDDERVCKQIVEEVRRHVDNVHDVRVVSDRRYICDQCGLLWEEEENGEPMCCSAAQEEWAALKEEVVE